ncbi:hypothetical protein SKAU_G00078790 [Synaphobranchus kaupii]|uniref:Uncharacterized protein n=1 Tax=Synaphobranchus kaupii TaxID=118154 RepID=A0A9Q1FV83_SYNKA|nr:hypothetical protein SKAU_G00078790 [Synaphobranchus kaupii]
MLASGALYGVTSLLSAEGRRRCAPHHAVPQDSFTSRRSAVPPPAVYRAPITAALQRGQTQARAAPPPIPTGCTLACRCVTAR